MTERQRSNEQVWLTHDWYIPVDHNGECIAESAEGALGFVIKLHSQNNLNSHLALKMPRLVGDTHRENAYTCQLMEQELTAVNQVFTVFAGSMQSVQGLLPAHFIGGTGGSPLRGRIATDPQSPWNQALIFVRFDKGRKPIFCLVNKTADGKLIFHPPSFNQNPAAPVRDITMFDRLTSKEQYAKVQFIENGTEASAYNEFGIDSAMQHDAMGITWYTGLPSVVYGWAPGTLQESISRGTRNTNRPWTIVQHLQLTRIMCIAMRNLHARGLIHADLRPANILIQGDHGEPGDYALTDYGSFAYNEINAAQPTGTDPSNTTKMPVLIGERASAFYAPERRLGREREAADTAVIRPEPNNKYILVLGWKSDLCINGKADKQKLDSYIESASDAAGDNEFPDAVLLKGDRVQIRDFIFELAQTEKRNEDKQILICNGNCWQIFHGKIAVISEKPFDDGYTVLPIPRSIELQKWSAATDIYSLGTLLLYSIFRSQPEEIAASENAGQNGSESASAQNSSKLEDEFREMLTYLNSRPYFESIWPELDWLRYCMEDQLSTGQHNAQAFAEVSFVALDVSSVTSEETTKEARETEDNTDLRQAAIRFTNRLTQTAPGIYALVTALDSNVAHFVFVMHFALSCIHRRSHIHLTDFEKLAKQLNRTWDQQLPFCEHRLEKPVHGNDAAASKALRRLEELLEKIVVKDQLTQMKPKLGDKEGIRKFDPRPDYSVRTQLDNEKRYTEQLRNAVQSIQVTANRQGFQWNRDPFKDIRAAIENIPAKAMGINEDIPIT